MINKKCIIREEKLKYEGKFDDSKNRDTIYVSSVFEDKFRKIPCRYISQIMSDKESIGYIKERTKPELAIIGKGGRQKIEAKMYEIENKWKMPVVHICLKGNDTNNPNGIGGSMIDWQISLNSEQIKELCDFLNVINVNNFDDKGKFTLPVGKSIESDYSDTLLNTNLIKYVKNNEDFLKELKNKDINISNSVNIFLLKERQEKIEEFKNRLNNKDLKEDKGKDNWQDWFSSNKWIFGSDYVNILDQRTINENYKADFLLNSYGGFLDLIEIKNPTLDDGELFVKKSVNKDGKSYVDYYPNSHLTQAISQSFKYIRALEGQVSNPDKEKKFSNLSIIKPRCLLIYGRSNNFDSEQFDALRTLNSHYNNFQIVTYDQLLEQAENYLSNFN